jgi:hypothetical protein
MGYSYDSTTGKLSCDACGHNAGDTTFVNHAAVRVKSVRKRDCPFNWCPAPALCDVCWSGPRRAELRQHHVDAGCKQHSERFHAELTHRAEMIAAGRYVRCSALGVANEMVHVIFTGKSDEVGRLMSRRTYQELPLLSNATVEDYENIAATLGEPTLTEAPTQFY